MRFIKVSTSNGEERWINLNLVTRVTLSHEAATDELSLVFLFESGDRVSIHASDDINKETIQTVTAQLDHLTTLVSHAA